MRIEYPGFLRLVIIILLLNLLAAQLLHEGGHWAVLQATGRQPVWGFTSLVQLWDRAPATPGKWSAFTDFEGDQGWLHLASLPQTDLEWVLFLAAGPLIQLVAVVLGFLIARSARSPVISTMGFLLAFVNAFSGFFYQVVSGIRGGGGDETLIGYYLNLSPLVVSLVLGLGFGIGLAVALRALGSWKTRLTWCAALVLGIFPVGPLLMRANTLVIEQVDAGHPLFRPVLGFSLPVFMTGLISLLLLAFLAYRWDSKLSQHQNMPG